MKSLIFLVVVLAILGAGGALTAQLLNPDQSLLPVIQQTDNPAASVTEMQPWKAEQFFLLVGAVVFNMLGIGATLAFIFWFLDRGVRTSRAQNAPATAKKPANAVEEAA